MKRSSIGVCCLIYLCVMNFAVASDPASKLEPTVESAIERAIKSATETSIKSENVSPEANPKPAENVNLKDVVDQPLLPEKTILSSEQNTAAPATDIRVSEAESASAVIEETANPEETKTSVEPAVIQADKQVQPQQETPKPGILKKLAQGLMGNTGTPAEPLVLLNSQVLPGTSTRLGWSAGASFVGISAPTAVLVLNGAKAGPTLCITGAVHGDEINGIEIVRRLMYNIDPKKLSGAVIGVPIVNLQGFRRGSRYLPDRRDLNRFFPGNPDGSSASRIAHSFFTNVVSHCDMLIDLHTGSFRRTNLPQLRADLSNPKVEQLAKKMGAIVVVQSEGAEGCLRRAAVEHGIPAVTLEAGAPHELSRADIEHGVKSIENAMDAMGMIKRRRFWERAAEPIYYESSWVRATDGGMLFSEIELGDEVRKGDLLGIVTDPITNKHSEIHAPYDGQIIGMALNQVMFPGFAAYHIGHAPSVSEEVAVEAAVVQTPSETQPEEAYSAKPRGTESKTAVSESAELTPIEDSE